MKSLCSAAVWCAFLLCPILGHAQMESSALFKPKPKPQPQPQPQPKPKPQPAVSTVRWHNYGKLTLPVDGNRDGVADDIQASELDTYSSSYFYATKAGQKTTEGYTAANGETVFWAPVNGGGTTKNTDTVRSEMREQLTLGNDASNWTTTGVHIQSGTVRVTKLPTPKKSGAPVKTIVAQIHAFNSNSPPLKLQFLSSSAEGTVVYAIYNESPNRSGYSASPKIKMTLKESFTYELKMANGIMTTKVNGQLLSTRDMRANWSNSRFYFKAGNYLQNTTREATGSAEVVYSALTVTHN